MLSLNNLTDKGQDYSFAMSSTTENESDELREVTLMACCQGQAETRFEQAVSGVFEFSYQNAGILGQRIKQKMSIPNIHTCAKVKTSFIIGM